ncbi:acyl-CoA thioesterase [Paenibacillus caui]|uniref:acyl-CoA thioesterase n=1 Tax=Paenibacillus caui TaxID=2873927 RepID=UPI001F15DD2D|nr:thioesterase family protein [Paenibacillus caui]
MDNSGTEHSSLPRWYVNSLRVRYQESDQMAVVYHANYLNWFEMGRTELIRELGFTYRSMEESGVLLPVTELDVKYKRPALYDDLVAVFTRVVKLTPLRLKFEYEVRRPESREQLEGPIWHIEDELPGELLVTGSTSHVWVNREMKPVRLDKTLPKLYNTLQGNFKGSS